MAFGTVNTGGGKPQSSSSVSSDSITALETEASELANYLLHHKYELANLMPQEGQVTLVNDYDYPFNSSEMVVTLKTPTETTDYRVEVEVLSGENVGDIVISDKQQNGFKLAFTGSCPEAMLKYFVIGGY